MQPFCLRRIRLDPRVFQQTCRFASNRRRTRKPVVEAVQYPPLSQPAVPGKRRRQEDDDEGIKWFEQDVETGERRRVTENPEETEARELRQKIRQLEAELRTYKSSDTEELDESLLAALSPEERAKVQRALREQKRREAEVTDGLYVTNQLSRTSAPFLNRFNTDLKNAALEPSSQTRRIALWKSYARAKYHVPEMPPKLPEKAWKTLWDVQTAETPTNPDRAAHVIQITNDMIRCGLQLGLVEVCARIDALYMSRHSIEAHAEWHDAYRSGRYRQSPELLELGLRMFVNDNQLDRALDTLQTLFELFPRRDARIIKPLISSFAKAGKDQMAFALYLLMRQKLGEAMDMKEYDDVTLIFLVTNKKNLALAAFRDMMLAGVPEDKRHLHGTASREQLKDQYNAILGRVNAMQRLSKDVEDVNKLSLTALGALPRSWQNKFFYASWIKKLLGMMEVDAAMKVVELMYERGVAPDPKHMNGIIAALFRCGDAEHEQRGEQVAWAMIQRRLAFVQERRQKLLPIGSGNLEVPDVRKNEDGVVIPLWAHRQVPPATIETFSVLAPFYVVKDQYSRFRQLYRMLEPAALRMTSFFMNQLLYNELYGKSQLYGKSHAVPRGPRHVWQAFQKHSKEDPTLSNLGTYEVLWDTELRHLDKRKGEDRSGFPFPRHLFSVMTRWHSNLLESNENTATIVRRKAEEDFRMQLYMNILQSFLYEKDLAGALVAMHGLYRMFKYLPDKEVTRLITITVSNLPLDSVGAPSIRAGRRRAPITTSRINIDNVNKVLHMLSQRRRDAEKKKRASKGERAADHDENRHRLYLLSEFIRVVLMRRIRDAEEVEKSIENAAREMGVAGISTGDINASSVA